MAQKRRTGLDKQSSALPIILGAIAVAAVLGLIGGVVWGLASSGKSSTTPPTPLPTQSSASPTATSPSATPSSTSPSPSPSSTSASPTFSASPTPSTSASSTPTNPSGIPPAPPSDVLSSNNWDLNQYRYTNTNGKFGMTAYVANRAATPRSGTFVVYVYVSGKYVGSLTGSVGLTSTTTSGPGVPITFTSVYPYQSGTKVILFTAK